MRFWTKARKRNGRGCGSWRGRLKPFPESLARSFYEDKKLALGDPYYVNILMRRLESHQVCDVFSSDEQGARQLLLMALRVLQQRSELGARRFEGSYRNELRAENETARRLHQRDAVEVSIMLGSHRRAVEAKCDPGFVDLKLLRLEHKKAVPMTPRKKRCREILWGSPRRCWNRFASWFSPSVELPETSLVGRAR